MHNFLFQRCKNLILTCHKYVWDLLNSNRMTNTVISLKISWNAVFSSQNINADTLPFSQNVVVPSQNSYLNI